MPGRKRIDLEDGKYTYVLNEGTGEQYVLRYGEPWRELHGDKFVYLLANAVLEAQDAEVERRALLRRLDVALNGEAGIAVAPLLIDIVAQAEKWAREHGHVFGDIQ